MARFALRPSPSHAHVAVLGRPWFGRREPRPDAQASIRLRGAVCSEKYSCSSSLGKSVMSPGKVEEHLAEKAEPVLGFKPSSSFKRSPIGILIYVVCGVLALISMRVAGVL